MSDKDWLDHVTWSHSWQKRYSQQEHEGWRGLLAGVASLGSHAGEVQQRAMGVSGCYDERQYTIQGARRGQAALVA
jgi:hypothetical protein